MQPLFLYGISFLIGTVFKPLLLIPLSCLLYFSDSKRVILSLLFVLTGFVWHSQASSFHPTGMYQGTGWLHISEVSNKTYYGQKKRLYKGIFKEFTEGEKTYKNIPVTLSMPEPAPPANIDWEIKGTLIASDKGYYFKPLKNGFWKPLKNTFSLAEFRFKAKSWVKEWVENAIPDKQVASLLGGLATGDFDDRHLKQDFGQLGLSHLLAISGFHFSLVALILGQMLKPFLSLKQRSWILMGLLGFYCLFLGGAPSILRAFIALLIFLAAPLFNAASNSENNFGAALLILLTFEPLLVHSVGFQLSFLATGAILFLFPLINSHLKLLFPVRKKTEITKLFLFDKLILVILSFIRTSLALNLAITVTMLPVLLAIFHAFPLASLIYNLFFPLALSFSILLLILSIFIPWLHVINSSYTAFLLLLSKEYPREMAISIKTKMISENLSIILITALFTFVFYKKMKLKYTIQQINL